MITIGIPQIYSNKEKSYLKAPVKISNDAVQAYMSLPKSLRKVHWRLSENYPPVEWREKDFGLWFSVEKEYGKYLCAETADAFVAAMLWYALATGSDIICEAPISENLLFSVNNFLIPALCTEKKGFRRISVKAMESRECFKGGGVGTGMSCGVDSLYTLNRYKDATSNERRLTHLCYFNMGAIFHPDRSSKKKYSLKDFYATTDKMSLEKFAQAKNVADKTGLPIIYIQSNMDSDFYRGAYGYTGVYRNCACVLAMQKLFDSYYCSSGGWPDYWDLSISEGSQHYEALICQCLSTESCRFILSDYADRIEKTAAIADMDIAQKYLDVCFRFNSCGHCSKCYRTLLTLDLLGKLDNFSKVFDINEYRNDKSKALGWLLSEQLADGKDDNAVFAREIYRMAKQKKMKIPISAYFYAAKILFAQKKKELRRVITMQKNIF